MTNNKKSEYIKNFVSVDEINYFITACRFKILIPCINLHEYIDLPCINLHATVSLE